MKTSYFANIKNLPDGANLISIARGNPSWYRGKTYLPLAPSWELIKKTGFPEPYSTKYCEQVLNKLNPAEVMAEIGEDAILLCWEKPGDFCHRRIVAEWLEKSLGIKVPEFENQVILTKKGNGQRSLF